MQNTIISKGARDFSISLHKFLNSIGVTTNILEKFNRDLYNMEHDLVVVVTNYGEFRSGQVNGEELTQKELFEMLGIKRLGGIRLEKHLEDFSKVNTTWNVEWYESNID